MKTFILLLTVWSSDNPPSVYVLDHDMSGAECVAAMESFVAFEDDGIGTLSCEFDHALDGDLG